MNDDLEQIIDEARRRADRRWLRAMRLSPPMVAALRYLGTPSLEGARGWSRASLRALVKRGLVAHCDDRLTPDGERALSLLAAREEEAA